MWNIFYNSYITFLSNIKSSNLQRTYNRELFVLIISYYYGSKNDTNYLNKITTILHKKYLFHKKDVLVFSKMHTGYGGVQKTTDQILKNIDRLYNIKFVSCRISNKQIVTSSTYFHYNRLNNNIPNCIIVK